MFIIQAIWREDEELNFENEMIESFFTPSFEERIFEVIELKN
jgi:hypothetical protein